MNFWIELIVLIFFSIGFVVDIFFIMFLYRNLKNSYTNCRVVKGNTKFPLRGDSEAQEGQSPIDKLDTLCASNLYWDKFISIFKQNLKIVPWGIKDVFRVCLGLFFIYAILNLTAYGVSKFVSGSDDNIKYILNIISGLLMYGAGTLFMIYFINPAPSNRLLDPTGNITFSHGRLWDFWRRGGIKEKYASAAISLGINWTGWIKKSLKSILLYVSCFPFLIGATYIGITFCVFLGIEPASNPMIDILKKEKSVLFIVYLVIVATIFAPIFEEFLFRGLLYQSLKKKLGLWTAVFISSILFSFLHFNTAQFLPIFGLGILLCLVFEYTGSIVPVIVLHVFNNALFMGVFFLLKNYL